MVNENVELCTRPEWEWTGNSRRVFVVFSIRGAPIIRSGLGNVKTSFSSEQIELASLRHFHWLMI